MTEINMTDIDYHLYRIARPNSTPIYGWGWEHHAEALCDRLNEGLEIDLHVAHRVTDLDTIAESGMDACMLEEELGL